jgi:hypothetical protein
VLKDNVSFSSSVTSEVTVKNDLPNIKGIACIILFPAYAGEAYEKKRPGKRAIEKKKGVKKQISSRFKFSINPEGFNSNSPFCWRAK